MRRQLCGWRERGWIIADDSAQSIPNSGAQVRQRIEKVIREAFGAYSVESQVQIAESNLARIHIVARTSPSDAARIDAEALERRVAAAVRSWLDAFKTALLSRLNNSIAWFCGSIRN